MKKVHKWAARLLAAAVSVAALAGMTVFADDTVTAGDEAGLVAAVGSAVDGTQTTIQLSAPVTLMNTLSIPVGKVIVLDLNGQTLTVGSDVDVIDNNGTLTVKNGTVASFDNGSNTQGMAVDNLAGATVTVLQDEGFETRLIGRCGLQNYGTAVIENGTVTSYNRNAMYTGKGSTTTINGGSIAASSGSSGMGRALSAEGNVTITGGTFTATGSSGAGDNYMNAISIFYGATLRIQPAEGKTVTVTSETDYAVSSWDGIVEIYGGTFACNGVREDVYELENGSISIYGGTFKHSPLRAYLPANYVSVEQPDGTFAVFQAAPSADITVSTYEELASVLQGASAVEPKNITVGASFELPQSADLTLPESFTLNIPANTTLTVSGILRAEGTVSNSGTLTVSATGFIENPLNVQNSGTITDYPVAANGVCTISTPMQLQWLSHLVATDNNNLPAEIVLANNITLPNVKFTPIGNSDSVFYYKSVFDGQNHTIANLNVLVTSEYHGGLFGYIGDVVIRNLTINGTNTNSTTSYIGALAGYAGGTCLIENVHVANYTVNSPISYGVGGFIGQIGMTDSNARVDFVNCTLDADITGYANVGAFWGTSTGSAGTIGIYNSTLAGTAKAINVNCGICGGYGDSAAVQIIGLDNAQFAATTKDTPETKLVSASSDKLLDTDQAAASQYQAVKDADGNWTALDASAQPEASIGSIPYATLEDAVANASAGDTVTLMADVAIDEMLDIKTDGVTLDLNKHSVTASENFVYNEANPNASQLLQVTGDDVTVKNGTLTATENNKHTLNVYNASGVLLQDLTLDHTNGVTGAPLVISGSDATLAGRIKLVTGEHSWYGMNVDSREIDGQSVSSTVVVAENASLTVEGTSKLGIYLENTEAAGGSDVSIEFKPNVAITSPVDGFVAISKADEKGNLADAEIIHPENAGLEMSEEGTSVPHQHTTELRGAKAATCTEEGYTGDLVCTVCGAVVEQGKAIARIPHNFVDGKCTVCGAIDTGFRPEIIEGANAVWTAGSASGLTIVSNAAFDDFLSVSIDGTELDAACYTAVSGSTRITLHADYLATLSAGQHTIAIASETGVASTTFTIQAAASSQPSASAPVAAVQTGDNQTPFVWAGLLVVSAVFVCTVAICIRRRKSDL